MSVCLSVCLSVYLSIWIYLSIYLSTQWTVYLPTLSISISYLYLHLLLVPLTSTCYELWFIQLVTLSVFLSLSTVHCYTVQTSALVNPPCPLVCSGPYPPSALLRKSIVNDLKVEWLVASFSKRICKNLSTTCWDNIKMSTIYLYSAVVEILLNNSWSAAWSRLPSESNTLLLVILGGPTKVKPTYIFVCKIWIKFEWIDKINDFWWMR